MLLQLHHQPLALSHKTVAAPTRRLLSCRIPPPQCSKTHSSTNIHIQSSTTDPKTPNHANNDTLPQSAIQRIAQKLRSLGFTETQEPNHEKEAPPTSNSAGEIFVPLPSQLPKHRVGHTIDTSWSTPENPVPEPGGDPVRRMARSRDMRRDRNRVARGKEKVPTLAELKLSRAELRRLRTLGIGLTTKLKIGKAGITEGIVNGIHERWRSSELVKIVCDDICEMNMKRTHDLLERKTGGLVIWRSGSKIVLYRGPDYKYPYFSADALAEPNMQNNVVGDKIERYSARTDTRNLPASSPTSGIWRTLIHGAGSPSRVRFQLPGEAELVEEADRLLDGLGPRFTDWWGYEPLPVDGDLLPAVIPGYRRPFRLLPYGASPKLTNDEMTTLRRLGRHLPCHFAVGRNRKLHGLAASIVKLWEKCEIAKIAVKRGVQNAHSELIAEELRWLTGGALLSRDKDFIVLYRGKDFLPSAVSSAIEERRRHVIHGDTSAISGKPIQKVELEKTENDSETEVEINVQETVAIAKLENGRSTEEPMERTSIKLAEAKEEKEKAEKLLLKLEKTETPQKPFVDNKGITEEERYMLREVGLRMKPFLLMGRRGIFDGIVENMHLHWKYRELVKIIVKERNVEAACQAAQTLEAESGGILVAVERVSKGYAIIVYRGKNYERPACLRPRTLPTKKEAAMRYLEEQRRKSLKLHILELSRNIGELQHKLDGDVHGSDSTSLNLDDNVIARSNSQCPTEALLMETCEGTKHHIAGSTVREKHASESIILNEAGPADSASSIKNLMSSRMSNSNEIDTARSVPENKPKESFTAPVKSNSDSSVSPLGGNQASKMASGTVCLTNKERLILRKQALGMKKRPVLAVGRSNIVTGLARAIKQHFERHPLAIVNVKGRAKGTSVQEVVRKLQEATGAVLVSHEPCKVILYRGWGAGYDADTEHGLKKGARAVEGTSDGGAQGIVSPELIAAIKLECGLQNHQQDEVGEVRSAGRSLLPTSQAVASI